MLQIDDPCAFYWILIVHAVITNLGPFTTWGFKKARAGMHLEVHNECESRRGFIQRVVLVPREELGKCPGMT